MRKVTMLMQAMGMMLGMNPNGIRTTSTATKQPWESSYSAPRPKQKGEGKPRKRRSRGGKNKTVYRRKK